MNSHRARLPHAQVEVLRELGPHLQTLGFYLVGGTALALHLGHRQSVDLDWFTSSRLDDPLRLAGELSERGMALRLGAVERGALHGDVRGVRVSFLEYRHPLLRPASVWPDFACPVASLDDLAAMKLLAVDQRGCKKDFLDIHALGTHGLSLAHMLDCFRRKFSLDDVARVLYSLCYFADADQEPMPVMHTAVDWEQAKSDLRRWVKALAGEM